MNDVTIDGAGSHLQFHRPDDSVRGDPFQQRLREELHRFDYTAPKVVDATVSDTGVADGRAYRVLTLPNLAVSLGVGPGSVR